MSHGGGQFCWHIQPFAGALVEDVPLRGAIGWLVRAHIAQCKSCQAALAALKALRERLRALRHTALDEEPTLGQERWAAMEEAWLAAERQREG